MELIREKASSSSPRPTRADLRITDRAFFCFHYGHRASSVPLLLIFKPRDTSLKGLFCLINVLIRVVAKNTLKAFIHRLDLGSVSLAADKNEQNLSVPCIVDVKPWASIFTATTLQKLDKIFVSK